MRAVLSIDIAKCKSMIMLSTDHGEVLMFMKQFLNEEIYHYTRKF